MMMVVVVVGLAILVLRSDVSSALLTSLKLLDISILPDFDWKTRNGSLVLHNKH